jgi:hypothetical protein
MRGCGWLTAEQVITCSASATTYRALPNRLWVKCTSAFAVGAGSVRIALKAADGTYIPTMSRDVLHVLEMSRRATLSYHGLFNLNQARQQGKMATAWYWRI